MDILGTLAPIVTIMTLVVSLFALFFGISPARYEHRQRAVVLLLACISVEMTVMIAVLLQIASKIINQAL